MFEYLNKILYKTKSIDTSNVGEDVEFVPYMVQRWSSMHSPEVADLVNKTSNRVWPIFDSKEFWYNYLYAVIPTCRFKRINYIKKKKDTEGAAKNKETVQKVANSLEISSREVSQYIEQFNLKLPNEKS